MTRLPVPGGDENTWGNVLNDYLAQAHNSDGTLKASAVAGAVGDATSTGKGLIQLTGDLGGTASSPTIPGLAGKASATDLTNHTGATTTVHGITNTANLETTSGAQAKVDTHANNVTSAHGYGEGLLAARPAATGQGFYFATDDNNGTLYRSVSGVWVKAAAAVQSTGMRMLGTANTPSGSFPMGTVTGAGSDAALGVALPGGGCTVTITGTGLPVMIRAQCWLMRASATGIDAGFMVILRDNVVVGEVIVTFQNVASPFQVRFELPTLATTVGSHTFELRVRQNVTSGTITTYGGSNLSGFLSIYEVVS